ncbi:MAG: LysR family transcriptional regulator [Ruminococcaceae bacterium]|nr:LysR family transcriptional regulator [Oscillospiraceae bacterium]
MFTNKEYVLAIYREGSFSKAAQRLYISQPSLSASIKRIESKLTMPIFNRATTPVSLTPIGEEYVKYALDIEEKERDFERYLSDRTSLLSGNITIGGSSLFSSFLLPQLISDFNKKYPKINFEISEGNTKDLMNKITDGSLDLIIDNAIIDDDSLTSAVYTSEIMLIAVPENFKINKRLAPWSLSARDIKNEMHYSKKYNVALELFKDEPFIFLNPENDTGRRAELLFKKHGISPDVKFYLDQQVTAYNISGSGMGISFVSDTLIKYIDAEPSLCYYRLSDEEITRKIYFYRKNQHYFSLACQKFIEHSIN